MCSGGRRNVRRRCGSSRIPTTHSKRSTSRGLILRWSMSWPAADVAVLLHQLYRPSSPVCCGAKQWTMSQHRNACVTARQMHLFQVLMSGRARGVQLLGPGSAEAAGVWAAITSPPQTSVPLTMSREAFLDAVTPGALRNPGLASRQTRTERFA